MAYDAHFAHLSSELSRRAARAILSQIGPASPALRAHLTEVLSRDIGTEGGLLGCPVFESLFDWALHESTLETVPFLSPRLVGAMDDLSGGEFRFPRTRHPRTHQLQAWDVLCSDPARSVLVRTGTASGKTECFMVPVLNDLARELDEMAHPTPLEGVRALFLYPLNALIQSQRNRLRAWSSGFKGLVRFALYNGITPESVAKAKQDQHPEEVLCRTAIRRSPPPVLVTNSTMLEYALVRGSDGPILERSKGKLRWIILDEAHTYLGSTAAEVALLLRRVMDAFEVDPAQVRFVATSATIGDANDSSTTAKLQRFLADLGGIDPGQVVVVDGKRVAPSLPATCLEVSDPVPGIGDLRSLAMEERFQRMASSPALRNVRQTLEQRHASLDEISTSLFGESKQGADRRRTMEMLDLASGTTPGVGTGTAFLPLRGHFFGRTMAGLWACCDRDCTETDRPKGEGWGFGAVYLERRTHCRCEALCFELQFCRGCGQAYLAAFKDGDGATEKWSAAEPIDLEDEEEAEGTDEEEPGDGKSSWDSRRVLLVGHGKIDGAGGPSMMNRSTGGLNDDDDPLEISSIPMPGENPRCVRCREGHRSDRPLVGPARLGANFFLGVNTPTLLEQEEAAPEGLGTGGVPTLPAEGRRLLTFSDSRQGSARFALRSQLGAERNYVRAFLYHRLWSEAATPDPSKVTDLKELIDEVEASSPLSKFRSKLPAFKAELEELESGRPISWQEMQTSFAKSPVVRWMRQTLALQFPPASALSESEIARIALIREFARRPRRQNSLETMGLVSLDYAGLDTIGAGPASWADAGFRADEWRSFLKIALDFFVRNHTALLIDGDDLRWVGAHFSTPVILAPDGDGVKNRAYPWPTAARGKAPVRLHRYLAPMLDPALKDGDRRAQIDAILRDAWLVVCKHVLTQVDDGWRLNLATQGRFRVVRKAWLCPMTGRLFDTLLRRRSPYLSASWVGPQECIQLEMPSLAYPFPQVGQVPLSSVLHWLETDERVKGVRAAGAWNEFSDRIATMAPTLYFRTGEHSAQQSPGVLQHLEKAFNDRSLNVLSCSTTMEMGVDIGGLNTVAMNNVPPAPANYRQRAGRAGRSGSTRATVMTLCNTSPHGEEVFRNTLWPFTAAVAIPSVSLESRRIVERHVNALCLGRFLRSQKITDGLSLECAGFFLPAIEGGASILQRFSGWLEAHASDNGLALALARLVKNSALQTASAPAMVTVVMGAIAQVSKSWMDQREVLLTTLAELGGDETMGFQHATPAQRAVHMQLTRIKEEYLLRHLASEGFLPSHGFPLHVVPFVTLTLEVLKNQQLMKESGNRTREEVGLIRNGFPSRHLSQAIREYAPGAGVVLNGMVYKSEGLALNWKRPVTEADITENQDLGEAWQCRRCGAADFTRSRPGSCPFCGGTDLRHNPMLRPAGFSVDLFSRPDNDVGRPRFIPVEEPWISASGATWSPLGGTSVGRFRHSADGKVVYRNRGADRHGYAICLHCGRAAPETEPRPNNSANEPSQPPEMLEHRRLRGGKEATALCAGNESSFAVRRHVVLGGVESTDVLELQLQVPGTEAPVRDETVCATLAVALRRAVAEKLGVDSREIGWSVIPSRTVAGEATRSLVLFDTADGGAGYVTAVAPFLREIIGQLPGFLDCPRKCDRACHGCLMGYDTQWAVSRLDRTAARTALSQEFLDALHLPPALQVFGTSTELECRPMQEALAIALQSQTVTAIRVHLGDEGDWDLSSWPLLPRLRQLSEQGTKVKLVITEKRLKDLSWSEARELYEHSNVGGFHVAASNGPATVEGGAALIVEVEGEPSGRRWAITADTAWTPGESWGEGDGAEKVLTTTHGGALPDLHLRNVQPGEINKLPPGFTQHVEWKGGSLNGDIASVGKRFWDGLSSESSALKGALSGPSPLRRVFLRDRYVNSPLAIRVVFEVFQRLRACGASDEATEFVLETRWNAPESVSTWGGGLAVYRSFTSLDTLKGVLDATLGAFGKGTATVQKDLRHDRLLELTWQNGKLPIHLDQGLTFLKSLGNPTVMVGSDPAAVAKAIRDAKFMVSMPEPTTVHVGQIG